MYIRKIEAKSGLKDGDEDLKKEDYYGLILMANLLFFQLERFLTYMTICLWRNLKSWLNGLFKSSIIYKTHPNWMRFFHLV